jgi:hypothetical protein
MIVKFIVSKLNNDVFLKLSIHQILALFLWLLSLVPIYSTFSISFVPVALAYLHNVRIILQ